MSFVQVIMSLVLYYLSTNKSKLMSILTRGGNSNSSSPIIIIEALIICQLPKFFLRKLSIIMNHSIMSRSASSFSYILSHQIEVEELRSAFFSNNSSLLWVFNFISFLSSEEILNSFINTNEGQRRLIIFKFGKRIKYLLQFVFNKDI